MGEKIAFIGLGAMGGPMAQNIVKKGTNLSVYDIEMSKMTHNILLGVWKAKFEKSTSQDIYYDKAQGKYYGWNVYGRTTTTGEDRYNKWYGKDCKSKTGDIIEMILDLNHYQLIY